MASGCGTILFLFMYTQNHFSGVGTVDVGERRYQIEMALQHGNNIESLTSKDFIPQGAVAVVTSKECTDWLRALVERLWLFDIGGTAPYRGMPLVILALDKGISSLVLVVTPTNHTPCNTRFSSC